MTPEELFDRLEAFVENAADICPLRNPGNFTHKVLLDETVWAVNVHEDHAPSKPRMEAFLQELIHDGNFLQQGHKSTESKWPYGKDLKNFFTLEKALTPHSLAALFQGIGNEDTLLHDRRRDAVLKFIALSEHCGLFSVFNFQQSQDIVDDFSPTAKRNKKAYSGSVLGEDVICSVRLASWTIG